MAAHDNRPRPGSPLELPPGNQQNVQVTQADIHVAKDCVPYIQDLYDRLSTIAGGVEVYVHKLMQGWGGQNWPDSGICPPIGAPYPCRPTMHPHDPRRVYGAQIPYAKCGCDNLQEAVKRMCWVEYTFRNVDAVAAGATIRFTIQVKWWFQMQKLLNLGENVTESFDLINIGYGQSNYSLTLEKYQIDGVDVPPNGIDVRRWNQGAFIDHQYPFPATALNDDVDLTWLNISGDLADITFTTGGPAVLQIG